MKNILSTMIIFGVIFLLIVIGAFVFDKFDGFGLIENMDNSINQGLTHLISDNDSEEIVNDNVSLNIIDNKTRDNETLNDNISNIVNDNKSMDNKSESSAEDNNTKN